MPFDHAPTCTRRDALRLLVGGAALAATGAVLAACTGGGDDAPTTAANTPDLTSFGAVGDGRADDTAALQRALDSLKPHEALVLPAGKVFCHSDVLSITTANVQLLGPGELRATREARSAVKVQAAGVTVDGVRFSIERTTQRWSTPDQHKLFIDAFDTIVVRDVEITGSAAAGLFALGATNFRFERVTISDTRADGIHMTYGASNGTVDSPVIHRSGDDGVAVVSYLQDGRDCHDIEVTSPKVESTTGGRGISVVGGHDITYRDVTIDGSNAASIYIACEGNPSNTSVTQRVTVAGGTITDANTNPDIDHGAVLVYSGRAGGMVEDIVISGLTVTGTRSGASRQVGVVADGADDGVSKVQFSKLTLATGPEPYQGNAPLAAVTLEDVTADGRAVRASVSS